MAGFCIRENDKVPIKPYRNGWHSNGVDIKDLETRLDIDILSKMLPDIFPAFFE
jgi:hypothetical protein